jgi:hypothetical protein
LQYYKIYIYATLNPTLILLTHLITYLLNHLPIAPGCPNPDVSGWRFRQWTKKLQQDWEMQVGRAPLSDVSWLPHLDEIMGYITKNWDNVMKSPKKL